MGHAEGLGQAELGRLGERLAERALARAGWRLIDRRVQTPAGEIDLVAYDADGQPVAVEVKTGRVPSLEPLPDPLLRPGRRLDWRGLERRKRAARFLAAHLGGQLAPRAPPGGGRPRRVRVDLVEVLISTYGAARLIHHRDVRAPPLPLPGTLRTPRERGGPGGRERG